MDEEGIVWVVVWATCLTEGCINFGIPIHTVVPEGGDIICGPCGQPVTDISTIPPEQVKELPEWISQMLTQPNSEN